MYFMYNLSGIHVNYSLIGLKVPFYSTEIAITHSIRPEIGGGREYFPTVTSLDDHDV